MPMSKTTNPSAFPPNTVASQGNHDIQPLLLDQENSHSLATLHQVADQNSSRA
jgi:hypothetical protein